jgi:hypothetical protein
MLWIQLEHFCWSFYCTWLRGIISHSRVCCRCPLSRNRIKIPCKGVDCKHYQCFDLQSFLQNAKVRHWCCSWQVISSAKHIFECKWGITQTAHAWLFSLQIHRHAVIYNLEKLKSCSRCIRMMIRGRSLPHNNTIHSHLHIIKETLQGYLLRDATFKRMLWLFLHVCITSHYISLTNYVPKFWLLAWHVGQESMGLSCRWLRGDSLRWRSESWRFVDENSAGLLSSFCINVVFMWAMSAYY